MIKRYIGRAASVFVRRRTLLRPKFDLTALSVHASN